MPPKNKFTIETFTIWWSHHFTVCAKKIDAPLDHFTIWKIVQKSLYHFTTKPYWHIPIIQPYHHFTISWPHRFIIQPLSYKLEHMQYNRNIRYKVKQSPKINWIYLVVLTNIVVKLRKIRKHTILLQKKEAVIFRYFWASKGSNTSSWPNRWIKSQIFHIKYE